jgi:hypothetical protein
VKCFEKPQYSLQFGFGKSTKDAITSIIDSVSENLSNKTSSCVLSNLSKASECTVNKILLSKVYQYGIHGMPHNFIKSCFTNRT